MAVTVMVRPPAGSLNVAPAAMPGALALPETFRSHECGFVLLLFARGSGAAWTKTCGVMPVSKPSEDRYSR